MAQESIECSELMKRLQEGEDEEVATQEKAAGAADGEEGAQRVDAEPRGDGAVGGGEEKEEVWELTSIPWPAATPAGKEAREEGEGSASTTRGRRGHLASVYYHLILIWDVVQGECLRALEGHTLEGTLPLAPPASTCRSLRHCLSCVVCVVLGWDR